MNIVFSINLFKRLLNQYQIFKKNIDMYTEQNDGENYYNLLRELMYTMSDKELKQYYDHIIQYYKIEQ